MTGRKNEERLYEPFCTDCNEAGTPVANRHAAKIMADSHAERTGHETTVRDDGTTERR